MTVHAIQGFIAPDSGMSDSDVQTLVDEWVSKRSKWNGGNWDARVERHNTAPDTSDVDYLSFGVRFEWSTDKQNTLQKIADKFKTKVSWFRFLYHVCGNDRQDLSTDYDCEWDERWNWSDKNVTVPSEIDARVPDADTVVNA